MPNTPSRPRRSRRAIVGGLCVAFIGAGAWGWNASLFAAPGNLIPGLPLQPSGPNGSQATVQNTAFSPAAANPSRPQYDLDAKLNWDLLTLSARARVTVPASPADPLSDVSFFLFANADGVGGAGGNRKNLAVQSVSMNGQNLICRLDGPVLKVTLPGAQRSAFTLDINYSGVVPRAPEDAGGMGGMLGADVGGLLGMGDQNEAAKKKNTDYGLYTATPEIVSLGAFWYPTLAMRENGRWVDTAPEGLGDVAYSQKSDYRASIEVPATVNVIAPGDLRRVGNAVEIDANDVRELAVIASDHFVAKSQTINLGGQNVVVSAVVTKANANKLNTTLDVAVHALQIFSRRFGNYPFPEFRVVESPMRGGAGGMEYSRMVGIASTLFVPFDKQLGGMVSTLNLPGADQLLKDLDADAGGGLAGDADLGGDKGDDANDPTGVNSMVGDILGQQKELFNSLLETTIAHEVAHQWWAIGVGSDSQRTPWVDESLTNYSAMLYFEDRYGRAKAEQMMDLHLKTSFTMGIGLGGGDKPANLPTSAYTNNMQYGAVIYGKAALFYDKLRELVGDQAFFAALHTYYATYNDKIAGPASLRNIVEAQAPAKKMQIEALYKRWIEGAYGAQDIGAGFDINNLLGGLMGGMDGGDE